MLLSLRHTHMSATKGFKIQAADDTIKRLHEVASALGDSITPNGIAAMATYEISRVPAAKLWQALGAIRAFAEEQPALPEGGKKALRAPREALTASAAK